MFKVPLVDILYHEQLYFDPADNFSCCKQLLKIRSVEFWSRIQKLETITGQLQKFYLLQMPCLLEKRLKKFFVFNMNINSLKVNFMKKLAFSTLYIFRLSVENLFGLVKSTLFSAAAVKSNLSDLCVATLKQLISDFEKYQQVVKKQRKSELTEKLLLADNDRNDRFGEIKRNISLHIKGRDTKKKAFAKSLEYFFKPYWDLETKPLNTETALLDEMFEKYSGKSDIQTAALNIGIDMMLSELEISNKAYDEMYILRMGESADLPDESATAQKSTLCDSYTEFCRAIEQAANFTPSESVLSLFKSMDELRSKYHALTPNGKDIAEEESVKESESA